MARSNAEKIQDQDSLRITDVANHIGKTASEVHRMIRSEIFATKKLTDNGHQRVTLESFIRYCSANGIDLPEDSLPTRKVIFVVKFNYDLLKKAIPTYLSTSIELVSLARSTLNSERTSSCYD